MSTNNSKAQPASLYAALIKAQSGFAPIRANRNGERNGHFFQYADLDELIRCTRPALAENGLGVMQPIRSTDGGGQELVTRLIHESGALEEAVIKISTQHSDLQEYAAHITMVRRIAYQAILCISVDVDLDQSGNGSAPFISDDELHAHLRDQDEASDPVHYAQDKFDASLDSFKKLITTGKKTAEAVIATLESAAPLTTEQRETILAIKATAPSTEGN